MRRFRCNQKGCCCRGWEIPFRLEDFLRLHEHLPEEARAELKHGIELVLEAGEGKQGERILHSLKLDGVEEDRACRFRVRARCLDTLADASRPPWRSLAALLHAFRRLAIGAEEAFEVVEPEDPGPFLSPTASVRR